MFPSLSLSWNGHFSWSVTDLTAEVLLLIILLATYKVGEWCWAAVGAGSKCGAGVRNRGTTPTSKASVRSDDRNWNVRTAPEGQESVKTMAPPLEGAKAAARRPKDVAMTAERQEGARGTAEELEGLQGTAEAREDVKELGKTAAQLGSVYARAIFACDQEGNGKAARWGLAEMLRNGITPSTTVYNAVLSASSKAKEAEEVLQLFDRMPKCGCQPDGHTYERMVTAFKDSHPDKAVEFLLRQAKEGHKIQPRALNEMMGALCVLSRQRAALDLFEQLPEGSYVADPLTITCLVCCCEKTNQHMKAVHYVDLLHGQGVEHRAVTYNWLITTVGKVDPHVPLELYDKMKMQGVRPNEVTYNLMITAYSKQGFAAKALALIEEMYEEGVEPTLATYGAMMGACNRVRQPEWSLYLFQEMKSRGIEPSRIAYNCAMKACLSACHEELAMQLFRDLKEQGLKPDFVTFLHLIGVCARPAPGMAFAYFEEMKSKGFKPTERNFLDLLIASREIPDAEKALCYFNEAFDHGLQPSEYMYNLLVDALVRSGHSEKVRELFRSMHEQGMQPSAVAYNSLIQAVSVEEGYLLYNEMLERGIEPVAWTAKNLARRKSAAATSGGCKAGEVACRHAAD